MSERRKAVLGSEANFWLWDSKSRSWGLYYQLTNQKREVFQVLADISRIGEDGFDLTHPPTASSPLIYPRLQLQAHAGQVTLDPKKSALVIIDMQNC